MVALAVLPTRCVAHLSPRKSNSRLCSEDYVNNKNMISHVTTILKLFALAAHRYSLCNYIWSEYSPPDLEAQPLDFTAYGEKVNLTPLPVGTPATLAYLSLYSKIRSARSTAIVSAASPARGPLQLRDCAWQQSVAVPRPVVSFSTIFKTGSVEGVWEGMFTVRQPIPSNNNILTVIIVRRIYIVY